MAGRPSNGKTNYIKCVHRTLNTGQVGYKSQMSLVSAASTAACHLLKWHWCVPTSCLCCWDSGRWQYVYSVMVVLLCLQTYVCFCNAIPLRGHLVVKFSCIKLCIWHENLTKFQFEIDSQSGWGFYKINGMKFVNSLAFSISGLLTCDFSRTHF